MILPPQVVFRDVPRSDAVEARILRELDKLDSRYPYLTSARIAVEQANRHGSKGRLYHVRVDVTLPGDEIVVSAAHHDRHAYEDPYVAVRDAFRALRARLDERVARLKRQTKTHEVPEHGVIVRLFHDAGYGFVETNAGDEVYFQREALVDTTLHQLHIGDEVRVVVQHGESAAGPQASTVKPIGKHHLPPVERV